MTNANFTFLIFFHKTPLSKGRLDYQSPFPFCKSAAALHSTSSCDIINFAVTLNPKIPARAFLWGTRTPPVSRECILLSLTVASVLKRKWSRRGKLGRGFWNFTRYSKFAESVFYSRLPLRVFSSESGPEGESSGGDFWILRVTANLISFCLVSCKVLCYDRTQYTERNR